MEHLSSTVVDSDLVKFFVDLGTTGVKAIDGLVNALTPLGTAALIGGGILSGKNIGTFKEQLSTISAVLNSTGNTTQLLTSFNALDTAQKKVLLSSKLLTDEQKAQCLTMATLSSANTRYTAEQLTKATGISAETLATWGLTEATDTLTMSQLAEMASSDAQAKKVLEKIVAQNAQAVANGEVTASNIALASSEGGATLATGAFTTAIKANISAMWTWMTTTPLGWLTLLAAGVFAAVKAYDALTTSVEEQKEKMEESLSAYEDAKSELSNITTELESQEQAMNELLAKEKLTYAEKGQLEELQAITQELLIQKDLAEKEEGRTKKEVATDTSDLFKKQFGKYDISESAINEYQNNADITGNNAILISDENDISAMIAGYRQFNELLDEAYGEGNQENIDHFKSLTDDLKDSIFTTAQDLQEQQSNISDYYNTIKDVPYEELTSDQKEIVDSYNAISNAIALIYKQLDPNTWNTMQIDNLFATEGVEKTKEELVEMAKEGTLDEKTIQSYSKLNSTLENSNMVLEDGQSAASALCDEMYALADAEGKVQDSTPSNKTDILSFSDAWNSEDFENARKELLSLAEAGQLTPETLQSTEEYKTLLEQTGLSAEEAAKKINSMTDASTQLQSMSTQISKISDMLADKKNGTVASASDLDGFDAEVRGLDSWKEFESVMGSTTSTIEECQAAANALATEWINNGNFLANLTDQNRDYYETQLSNMGIENSHIIVLENLAKAGYELSDAEQAELDNAIQAREEIYALQLQEAQDFLAKKDLNVAAQDAYVGLLQEAEGAGISKVALLDLIAQEQVFNNSGLSVSGKISELSALASAYLGTAAAARFAANTSVSGMGSDPRYFTDSYVQDQWMTELSNYKVNFDLGSSGSRKYKTPSTPKKSKGSSSTKDSKQEINWIDRKLSVLQSKIDLTKSKFDNLFNLTSPKNLKKNIDSITKSLSSAQSKVDSFKKKMSVVKLDDSTKKKVQKGTIKLSDYSKNDQKRIKQYQKYYSSYEKYATKVKNLQKQLNTLNSSRGKINNLETQIKQMKTLESATSKAIKKYESYAGKVGLSKSLRNKVKNGDYTITDYGSKTQAKIQKYQDYIDKIAELRQQLQEIQGDIRDTKIQKYQLRADDADAKRSKSESWTDLERVDNYKKINSHLEYQKKQVKESYKWQIKVAKAEGDSTKASQLRAEREKELRNLTKQEFDAIASAYDYQLKLNDAKRQGVQDALSLAESRGDQIGSAYYSSQISVNNADLNTRYEERERLLKKLSTMKKGSEEWYDSYDTLQGVNKEISSLINNNAELDRKIKQLKWDRFDELKNKIDDVITEASFLSDLLDSDNFFDDKGMITNDGVTAMGLALQNYDSYLAEAQKYEEQLAELEANKNNLSYDDYTSKRREYTQGLQNAIKSANDLKKTTISYVKQGLDAQNEALSKEIEQRKKLLEQAKTERDFNDKTLDQNKKIARLKRQIAILENDDSDSNRKTLRELRSQLQDVEKEQSDSFYDKSVSDQEDALDNMLENSKKQAEEYLKDTDKVFADAIVYVNAHADQVSTTLTKLAKDTGYNISEYITKAWRGSGSAVGDYASTMSKNVPKITQQIALITGAWEAQCLAADRAAEASAKAAQGFYSKGSGSGSGNTNNTNNSNSNDYSAKDIKRYITDHADKAKHKKSYYDTLNRYLYEKTGGKVLSVIEEVQLAKMLGVSVKKDLSGTLDRQKILNALKKKNIKFANGGILGDLVKVSGEDGLFIGSAGESVLTKEQTQALMKFAPIVPQMSNLMYNMKNVVPVNNRSVSEPHIEINTTVQGVATDQIVKDFENVATRQAENVVKKINSATYAKGVRFR